MENKLKKDICIRNIVIRTIDELKPYINSVSNIIKLKKFLDDDIFLIMLEKKQLKKSIYIRNNYINTIEELKPYINSVNNIIKLKKFLDYDDYYCLLYLYNKFKNNQKIIISNTDNDYVNIELNNTSYNFDNIDKELDIYG